VADGTVTVESIDAFDNTPIVDLKPYIPALDAATEVRLPGWVKS
jgi:tRNA (Thr-GGU) A37 N-methylase